MGKKDVLIKKYLGRNEIFADVFNYYLFNGEYVIHPEDLRDQDTNELAYLKGADKTFASQKMRDLLKLCTIRKSSYGTLVLLGIEGQSNVHYSMPVRDYLYDALNYASQVKAISMDHEKTNRLKGAEKLSGFSKDDHLIPVITLCICFDKAVWDGPKSLFEMFGDVDERIREYIDDYRLNLITPGEIEDFGKFATELGFVLEVIHNSDTRDRIYDIIDANKDRVVDVLTAEMINTYTGLEIYTESEEGGQVMMSQGVKEWREELLAEGRADGLATGIEKGANMLAQLLKTITPGNEDYDKALNATEEERKELFKKYNIV